MASNVCCPKVIKSNPLFSIDRMIVRDLPPRRLLLLMPSFFVSTFDRHMAKTDRFDNEVKGPVSAVLN